MINLKVIQINIFRGKFLDNLLEFLKSEDPDIITMQEVTARELNYYKNQNANIFSVIEKRLKLKGIYHGDLILKGFPNSLFGNAVFSKFEIAGSRIIPLKTFRPVTLEELEGKYANIIRPQLARHMLDATLKIGRAKIHVISIHGAWTAPPTDTKQTLKQARIIAGYIKALKQQPHIIGGDLNTTPKSKVIGIISKVSKNLLENSGVSSTLNPKVHKIAPRKLLVDYILASKHFKLKSLTVPEVTISDHLPVIVQLEF